MRVSQWFWGTREHWQNIEGNKGTLANFWEQGNKTRKITVQKHSERVWEHGNMGQFWKGTREQGPPLGDPHNCTHKIISFLYLNLGFILKIFLKFRKFQPRHSYKIYYFYKKKGVYSTVEHVSLISTLVISSVDLP